MKNYILLALATIVSASLFSQDWTATVVDENGKVKDSYLTNQWHDNLFIGVSGGISTRFTSGPKSDITKCFIDPAVNIYIMKWFTPRIGARLGYIGVSGREGLNSYHPYSIPHTPFPYNINGTSTFTDNSDAPGTLYYGSFLLHGDLMWNLMNTFSHYKRDRFYTISLYASGGYLRLFDNKTPGNCGLFSKNYDQEFVLGAGIYNTFRITDRLLATADLRYSNHASRYRSNTGVRTSTPAFTIGLTYNLCRTYWTDVAVVKASYDDVKEAKKVAEKKQEEAQAKNVELKEEVDNLEKQLQNYKDEDGKFVKVDPVDYSNLKARAASADLVVYFYINQTTLNFSEEFRIQNYATQVLASDPEHVFKITGSADKGTGNSDRNAYLSLARALKVKNILMKQFGVKESNIIISSVVTDKHIDGALDRCAMIER